MVWDIVLKFKLTIKRHLTLIFGAFSLLITVIVALVFNLSVDSNFEKYANNKRQELGRENQVVEIQNPNVRNSIFGNGQSKNYQLTTVELELRNSLITSILIIGAISFFISLIIGHFISLRLSKPLKSLTKMTEEIEKGSYQIKIEHDTNIEEISLLSNSLVKMANQISESIEKDKRLSQDVQHEIRTPLTNLKAQLEAMIDGVLDLDLETIRLCLVEVERLTKIVQQLHQLGTIENESDIIEKEDLYLYDIVNSIIKEFSLNIEKNNMETLNLIEKDFIINSNEELLYSSLYNLISNAIKYSGTKSQIKIYLDKFKKEDSSSKYYKQISNMGDVLKDYYIVSIEDNGVGIAQEDINHIFERFYRIDKSRSRKIGGSGLGLSIVYAAVSKLGGFITVESSKNINTIFSIFLEK
jgi:signal transduction histidine kinase